MELDRKILYKLVRPMSVRLRPSLLRTATAVLLAIGGVIAASSATGTAEHWWDRAVTLFVPVGIAFVAISIMFVPMRLEFTDTEFSIQFLWSRVHTISWDELEYYGPGNNVFMIQFYGRQAFQIFPPAFRRDQWYQLTNFLSTEFPDCKADGSFGGGLFKWRKK